MIAREVLPSPVPALRKGSGQGADNSYQMGIAIVAGLLITLTRKPCNDSCFDTRHGLLNNRNFEIALRGNKAANNQDASLMILILSTCDFH